MLTIGQLAERAGVTVRAVRHYHQIGLLAEPARDSSGYRRYDGQAVVDLVRIKTLADAGVPLARVAELLVAPADVFTRAVDEIEADLRGQLRELKARQRRLSQLRQGDALYLPPDVCALLDDLRALEVSDRTLQLERDSWILLCALFPDLDGTWVAQQRAALSDPVYQEMYLATDDALTWDVDDPRIPELAARTCDYVQAHHHPGDEPDWGVDAAEQRLIIAFNSDVSPAWGRLVRLVREELRARGYDVPVWGED